MLNLVCVAGFLDDNVDHVCLEDEDVGRIFRLGLGLRDVLILVLFS